MALSSGSIAFTGFNADGNDNIAFVALVDIAIGETIEEMRDRLSKELHILVVMISDAWGGLEQTALGDVRLLMHSGFNVTLLVRERSPMTCEAATAAFSSSPSSARGISSTLYPASTSVSRAAGWMFSRRVMRMRSRGNDVGAVMRRSSGVGGGGATTVAPRSPT